MTSEYFCTNSDANVNSVKR